MLNFIKTIEEWFAPVNNYIIENHGNPIFWIAIVIVGLAIFATAYSYFDK
jgi:hypothetical protein